MDGQILAERETLSLNSSKILYRCSFVAILIEFIFLMIMGSHYSMVVRPKVTDPALIEADVVDMPHQAPKLIAEKASAPVHEQTLSKTPTKNKKPTKTLDEPSGNHVQGGKPMSPTHGPILIESPSPVIPDYLKTQDLKTNVVIEFIVLADGLVTPRLLSSSGNEELDQIALATAKRWKFYPAENNQSPVDSKVRLRILFEVK